jgi:hypothetical protein
LALGGVTFPKPLDGSSAPTIGRQTPVGFTHKIEHRRSNASTGVGFEDYSAIVLVPTHGSTQRDHSSLDQIVHIDVGASSKQVIGDAPNQIGVL